MVSIMAIFKKKNTQSIPLRTPEVIAKENAEKEAEKVRILEASLDFVRLEKHKAEQEEKAKLQAAQKETAQKETVQKDAIQNESTQNESTQNETAHKVTVQEKLPPNFQQKNSVNANPLYGGVKQQQENAKTEINQDTPVSDSISVQLVADSGNNKSPQAQLETEPENNKSLQVQLEAEPEKSDIHTVTNTNYAVDRRKLYGRRMDYKTAVVSKKVSDAEEIGEEKKVTEGDTLLSKPEQEKTLQKEQTPKAQQDDQIRQEEQIPKVQGEDQIRQEEQIPKIQHEDLIRQEEQSGKIPNPLPVPKKHVSQIMNFDLEPGAEDMHFDLVDMTGIEYFDIN